MDKKKAVTSCPSLGTRGDVSAFYAYPSLGNCCYHCRASFTPTISHQEAYCLGEAQNECPVYSKPEDQTIPNAVRMHSAPEVAGRPWRGRAGLPVSLIIVILLSAFASYQYIPQVRALVMPTPPVFAKATLFVPTEPRPAQMLAEAPTSATPPMRPTAVASHTAAPPRHTLETAIRVNGQTFLIHTVKGGQTFEVLAETYSTTPDVIRALNYALRASLWANTEIIVAPGLKVTTPDLPAFEAYQVVDATHIDALAADLHVDPALLRTYNGCSDDCALAMGDWLMVPRTK